MTYRRTAVLAIAAAGAALFGHDAVARKKAPLELFNGRDLAGWTVVADPDKDASATWSVKDGLIVSAGKPRGYLRTDAVYKDYRLRLQWRWPERAGNSGVFVHGMAADKVWPQSYEAQLQAGNAGEIRANGGAKFHKDSKPEDRSLPKQAASSERAPGEWNDYEIVCRGTTVTLFVNGVRQNELKKATQKSGWIALQSEGAPIEFRAITLEPL